MTRIKPVVASRIFHCGSLVRNEYALSTRREFLGALFSTLLALALFDPGVATAQQGKEIKLTEKHIQSFMAERYGEGLRER